MSAQSVNKFRKRLLAWYDENRRVLPWRAPPGIKADPYRVWLSEIMLQQTVVAAVISYFLKFIEKWPTVHDLAAARTEDVMDAWAGLGYYARARNLHKCAKVIAQERGGVFPDNERDLQELPGIGPYTAAAIAAIAFDLPATVVDGNVERVVARWFGVKEPLPAAKKILRQKAALLSDGRSDRPGDFAQGMMDLGATVCTPKSPRCGACPVREGCAALKAGIAEDLPRRAAKKKKPKKFGYVYWITDGKGRVLLERRPENTMLGGMPGLPTSEWRAKGAPDHPAFLGKTEKTKLKVFHSFTHFDLELEGRKAVLDPRYIRKKPGFFWLDERDTRSLGLPSLFRKVVRLMTAA